MRKISRRDFVKKVGVGTAGALGLASRTGARVGPIGHPMSSVSVPGA